MELKAKYLFVFPVIIFVFLIGCIVIDKAEGTNESANETIQKQVVGEQINFSEEDIGQAIVPASGADHLQTSPSGCGGWKCISSFVKAYQYENCSFGKSEKCATSCINNTCAPAKICTSGFKCFNSNEVGHQKEDCSWSNFQKCQFGCKNGECSPMTEGYNATTNISGTETSEANEPAPLPQEPIVTIYSLKYGEEHQLDGKNFRIYNLESDRVILLVGSVKSNWLKIGDELSIGNSKIQIKDISYQPYVGGAQMVDYVVK